MRTENWCGHDIRFVEINGEWWAILKDICDALKLKTFDVSQRLSPDMLVKTRISEYNHPSKVDRSGMGLTHVTSRARKTQDMLAINEKGIYQALFASRRLEARKFQMWTFDILAKLRRRVGLQQYEVMRMTEPEIQDEIDDILDTLFWDEKKGCLMQSVTVPGGDVDQVPFE